MSLCLENTGSVSDEHLTYHSEASKQARAHDVYIVTITRFSLAWMKERYKREIMAPISWRETCVCALFTASNTT